jgi:hypothetical protein
MTNDSKPSEMTTPDKTPSSADTTNVLTALSSNDGTLSVTINIDKSTAKKAAWWLIALAIAGLIVMGAAIFFLGKVSAALDSATAETSRALAENARIVEREGRLSQQALDEKRMENRQAWKALGIDGNALEDHDISDIMQQVRKKYPLKEPEK